MKYLIIFISFFLFGCSTTAPVKHSLPEPPELIVERCPGLKTLNQDETRLSEFIKVVTENYLLYHDCAAKHDMLVRWYKEQKSIHDNIFNKK
jgi:hypothetical protein